MKNFLLEKKNQASKTLKPLKLQKTPPPNPVLVQK